MIFDDPPNQQCQSIEEGWLVIQRALNPCCNNNQLD